MSDIPLQEEVRRAKRCLPDVNGLAARLEKFTTPEVEETMRACLAGDEADALSLLLIACGMAKRHVDPGLLCAAWAVLDDPLDVVACFREQGRDAIPALLGVAQEESWSWERQAMAIRLAAELTIRENVDRSEALRVAHRLEVRITTPEAGLIVGDALHLLEAEDEDGEPEESLAFASLLEVNPEHLLPSKPVRAIIGEGGTVRRPIPKLGRNEPCRCGSGKKYKRCCYDKDQEILRDASSYEGVTRTEIMQHPALVDDVEVIYDMRAHQVARLRPEELSDRQLIPASRRAELYGHRELAFDIMLEAERRAEGSEAPFDPDHFDDLIHSCLMAGDVALARRIREHAGDAVLYDLDELDFRFELAEHPERYEHLEAFCREALTASADGADAGNNGLVMLAHAMERYCPALSVAFARAAIVHAPERDFDNWALLDVIREVRADLGLSPWEDPAEDLFESDNRDTVDERDDDKTSEEEARLRQELEEARGDMAGRRHQLQEMEARIGRLTRELEQSREDRVAARPEQKPSAPPRDPEAEETIARLRRQVQNMKVEIGNQQERQRTLRRQLTKQEYRVTQLESTPAPEHSGREDEVECEPAFEGLRSPSELLLPTYSEAFREKCRGYPLSIGAKALRAAAGFALRDPAVWRHAKSLEARPNLYRVRIGLHHRMLIEWVPGKTVHVLDLITRAELDTWVRRQG